MFMSLEIIHDRVTTIHPKRFHTKKSTFVDCLPKARGMIQGSLYDTNPKNALVPSAPNTFSGGI